MFKRLSEKFGKVLLGNEDQLNDREDLKLSQVAAITFLSGASLVVGKLKDIYDGHNVNKNDLISLNLGD